MAKRITLHREHWKAEHAGCNFRYTECYEMDVDTFRYLENNAKGTRLKDTIFEIDGEEYICLKREWWPGGGIATKVWMFAKMPVETCASGVLKEDLRLWGTPYEYVMRETKN